MSSKISCVTLLGVAGLVLAGAALFAGCGKDSPTVTVTTNDQLKAAHDSVESIRKAAAKGNPQRTHMAVANAASFLNNLTEWIASDGKGRVEERQKAIAEAVGILNEEVMPLATAEQVDQAALDARLADVDKLITQAQ